MPAAIPTPASARLRDRIAAPPGPDVAAHEEKLRVTREVLRPGDRLLEIGCGTGTTRPADAQQVAHLLATSVSAAMIAIAGATAAGAGAATISFRRAALARIHALVRPGHRAPGLIPPVRVLPRQAPEASLVAGRPG